MNRLVDFDAVGLYVIPSVIIIFKIMYGFGVLIFWQRAFPTHLRHLDAITPGCFTNRTADFQEVTGMQAGLAIT